MGDQDQEVGDVVIEDIEIVIVDIMERMDQIIKNKDDRDRDHAADHHSMDNAEDHRQCIVIDKEMCRDQSHRSVINRIMIRMEEIMCIRRDDAIYRQSMREDKEV